MEQKIFLMYMHSFSNYIQETPMYSLPWLKYRILPGQQKALFYIFIIIKVSR